ncbi:MAG: hypothetical protein JW734_01225 [Candidatus Omnitrophica bacterium]|nr:hypothetical protein [Candidatus Omnitrophota bacterium]
MNTSFSFKYKSIKGRLLAAFFINLFIISFFKPEVLSQDAWEQFKGDHFIVYYVSEFKEFARQVLREAEKNYKSLADYLGYARYSNFWTWDNRVKIYIYPDRLSYLKATNQPKWSAGVARYLSKEIISFAWSDNFMEFLLPHEMAHLMFRDFVGFKGEVPLWLDEGVAQWAEVKRRDFIMSSIGDYIKSGKVMPLEYMMTIDLSAIRASASTAVTYNSGQGQTETEIKGKELIDLYYLQAASIVGFLIERYGPDRFTDFCRGLRDAKTLVEALRSAYPNSVSDLDDLQDKWLRYVSGRR